MVYHLPVRTRPAPKSCRWPDGIGSGPDPLTELLRSGARRLVEAAVRAEFEEYLSSFGHEKLPDGRQRVVRNGRLPERKILTGLGEVDVRVPKARSRSGSPEPFRSSVAPPYVRRCASLDAAIPWLYLHGVSTGQMRQAVAALVGEQGARGLSANVVSRLKRSWDQEYQHGVAGAWTTSGSTCGRTACTAVFAAKASGCACWSSLA